MHHFSTIAVNSPLTPPGVRGEDVQVSDPTAGNIWYCRGTLDSLSFPTNHMLPKQPNHSIIDGIRCLQAVVSHERAMGISEVAKELGLEITKVHRLLRTLTHMGLIEQTKGRKYTSGSALPVLAAQTLHAIHFAGAPIKILNELFKSTGLVVALGVRWQRQVSYLYHLEPGEQMQEGVANYRTWPAEISGLGVAMLAHLSDEEIRALYMNHTIQHFTTDELLELIRETRRNGYCYLFPTNGSRTLAIRMRNNPNMALGIAGAIAPHEVANYLGVLRETVVELEQAFTPKE